MTSIKPSPSSCPSRSSWPLAPASQVSAIKRSACARAVSPRNRTANCTYSVSFIALVILLALSSSGCYYAELARGQARLLSASRPVQDVLNDPKTSTRLHARLEVVERARQQAQDLGLDVKGQYTSFVPWPGDRVITTVVATRPRELEPAGFSFLLVGNLPYKGFFEQKDAETEAATLRADGFDTCVSPVTAYSTLGWLDDPVTEPMLRTTHARIAETIVHELVHGTIFIPDDAAFNESLATFVGQEASVRFFPDPASAAEQRAKVQDARLLAQQTAEFSAQVKALYGSPTLDVSRDRAVLESHFREHLAGLPFRARTPAQAIDLAEKIRLNDACLALRGTYGADLSQFQNELSDLDGDLAEFIRKIREVAKSPHPRATLSTHQTPSQN